MLFAMFSCEGIQKKDKGVFFYPNVGIEYFHVDYQKDSIVITEKYKYEKYKYTADSAIFLGEFDGRKDWILIKKNNEYYLKKDGCEEIFMSNKGIYTKNTFQGEMGVPTYSVTIKKTGNSLYESTLYVNVTKTHRNPLLCLIYDKSYKIKKIKKGMIYVDCDMQNE